MSLAGAMAQHASVMAAQKKEKDALIEAVGDFSGIRPLEEKDLRVVRQLVGQSVMEGLAESNVISECASAARSLCLSVAKTIDRASAARNLWLSVSEEHPASDSEHSFPERERRMSGESLRQRSEGYHSSAASILAHYEPERAFDVVASVA
jgi:hypothetical protein